MATARNAGVTFAQKDYVVLQTNQKTVRARVTNICEIDGVCEGVRGIYRGVFPCSGIESVHGEKIRLF